MMRTAMIAVAMLAIALFVFTGGAAAECMSIGTDCGGGGDPGWWH